MPTWSTDVLGAVDGARRVRVSLDSGHARSASESGPVVRSGRDLYVRTAGGPDDAWFREAVARRRGRLPLVDGVQEVALMAAGPEVHAALDDVYRETFGRCAPATTALLTDAAAATTLRGVLRRWGWVPRRSAGAASPV